MSSNFGKYNNVQDKWADLNLGTVLHPLPPVSGYHGTPSEINLSMEKYNYAKFFDCWYYYKRNFYLWDDLTPPIPLLNSTVIPEHRSRWHPF
jgi:hypothetical protein